MHRLVATAKDVSNPLIVLMAIAKNGDKDDIAAKQHDYINIMFAFNHLLGYSVVYNSVNNDNDNDKKDNDDLKQQESKKVDTDDNIDSNKIKFNYIKDRMKHQDIQSESYQLLWKKQDIDEFGKNMYDVISDENNKHDGVFFYLLFYHNDDDPTTYGKMIDSYGNTYAWLEEQFFRRLNPVWYGLMEKYPKIWFVEVYQSIDGTFEDAKKKNIKIRNRIRGNPFVFKTGDSMIWSPYQYTHVIPNANKNGGILTQATKKIFRHPSVAKGRCLLSILLHHMEQWVANCDLAIRRSQNGGYDGAYLVKPK